MSDDETTSIEVVKRKPGRPPRDQDKYSETIKSVLGMMVEHLPTGWERLKDLIEGVWVEDRDAQGNIVRVYQRPPSIEAIKFQFERTMGKTPQTVTLDAEVNHNLSPILDGFTPQQLKELLQIGIEEIDKEDTAAIEEAVILKETIENTYGPD